MCPISHKSQQHLILLAIICRLWSFVSLTSESLMHSQSSTTFSLLVDMLCVVCGRSFYIFSFLFLSLSLLPFLSYSHFLVESLFFDARSFTLCINSSPLMCFLSITLYTMDWHVLNKLNWTQWQHTVFVVASMCVHQKCIQFNLCVRPQSNKQPTGMCFSIVLSE